MGLIPGTPMELPHVEMNAARDTASVTFHFLLADQFRGLTGEDSKFSSSRSASWADLDTVGSSGEKAADSDLLDSPFGPPGVAWPPSAFSEITPLSTFEADMAGCEISPMSNWSSIPKVHRVRVVRVDVNGLRVIPDPES